MGLESLEVGREFRVRRGRWSDGALGECLGWGDCLCSQRLMGRHPLKHVGHGDGVGHPLGLVEDRTG